MFVRFLFRTHYLWNRAARNPAYLDSSAFLQSNSSFTECSTNNRFNRHFYQILDSLSAGWSITTPRFAVIMNHRERATSCQANNDNKKRPHHTDTGPTSQAVVLYDTRRLLVGLAYPERTRSGPYVLTVLLLNIRIEAHAKTGGWVGTTY